MSHLWEIDHPYYCSETNFRVPYAEMNGNHIRHASWADFMDSWGGTDPDLNLLFRWDWHSWRRHSDPGLRSDSPDELQLFFILQRKGDFWAHTVTVTDEDEPAVRAWLEERAKTIAAIWAPLALAGEVSTQPGGCQWKDGDRYEDREGDVWTVVVADGVPGLQMGETGTICHPAAVAGPCGPLTRLPEGGAR